MSTRNSSKKFHSPAIRTSIALSTLIVASPFVQAVPIDWINDVDGLWDDASLWSSDPALPGSADDVSITTVTGLKTVTHDTGSDTIKSLTTNDSARVLVNGGSSLRINGGGTNAGILQAGGASAGTLTFAGGTLTSSDGELLADNDGVIALTGVNLVGGELSSSGSGSFLVSSSAANFLRGVTLNGVLDMTSITNSRQRVTDDMTLNGTVDINSNGILSFDGDNLLEGAGTLVFGDTGAGNRLDLSGNGTTTFGSGITVRGENGTIGNQINIAGTQVLVNEGLISADVSGGTITIQESAVINNNVLEARDGGTLNLRTQVDNSAGEIRADDGVVNLNAMRVIGGEMNSTGTGEFLVTGSSANFLENVAFSGLLDMASITNSRQRVTDGITLDGTIDINANGILSFDDDNLVEGTGTVVFGDTGAGNRLDLSGNGTTTLASGITVRGENGTIGQQINIAGTQVLVNEGLISADVNGGTITIQESAVVNNNVLEARNGGTLNLRTQVDNSAGEIRADDGVVNLNAMRVIGGDLNSTGSGKFLITASASNYLEDVTATGLLDMASNVNSRQRVADGITLDGTVDLNNNGILSFEGDNLFEGNATVVFGDTGAGNRFDLDGNGTTTLGSGITIRGENGTIGNQINIGGTQVLVNNGLISADVTGGTITITDSRVNNNTVMEARNGASLVLKTDVNNAASAVIHTDNGLISQEGIRVTGGTISTENGGVLRANGSGANYLDGMTFEGMLDMATTANSRERVVNDLTLDGTINLNANGILGFEGSNVLDGDGTVVLGDTGASNRISLDGNGTTTVESGITIRGENGTIGGNSFIGGTQVLVNNGLISADVAGGTITIEDSKVDNNTVIEARNDANLILKSDVNNAASAVIHADNSLVLQEGIRVTGGTISTENGGVFRANGNGANYLDGMTFEGMLDMATIANSREKVVNDLTLNGTINLNTNGILSFEGDNVLDGDATVVLGGSGPSNRISLDGNGTTTVESGIIIRGENGTIGGNSFIGGTQVLVNNGLISADVAGGTFTITDSTVNNNNALEARNDATLILDSNVNNSASAGILADNGIVLQSGQRVTGGTIATDNGGLFRVSASGANYLDAATVAGTMDMATIANGRERVVNGLTLDGLINLNLNSRLSFEGNNTVDGAGTLILGGSGAGNQITLEGNGITTIDSGVTIRGESGTIGDNLIAGGTQVLINNGTINSDGGGTITFKDSAVTNNGLLRAQNGTMTSQVQVSGAGTLQVDSTAVMNLANLANTQGTLAMGSAGAALNIGTQNLTINSDYTNTAAGTGNSFDRRAGVSGTGQIVAGGDAAQAITGTGVTDGATPNATLTIGNMRVGDNTFNYQVANTGTTGPSLRGAIQTSVNGGNIDDARLSGAGVTASNYNTGTPGSDTGDLAIVFNAATAGALAPLVDQTVNLRSNFENIGDQQLDIVLAGSAAAYNAAVGDAGSPVQVANQRIGGTNTAAVSVDNIAPAGSFSEDLNATVGSMTGAASGSGSIAGLLAGVNNNSDISVGVDTSAAGARSGTVTLDYETTGTVNGVSNGLGTASAGSQAVTVNGNVFRLAEAGAHNPEPVVFADRHVGDSAEQALSMTNTAADDSFSERLNAIIGGDTGDVNSSGSFNLLAAQDADNSSLVVGIDTGSAGAKSGTATISSESDGTGTSGIVPNVALADQTVNVSGNVYRLAEASAHTPEPVTLANVRVGETSEQALTIGNTAAADGFSEALNAVLGVTSGDATGTGSVSQLAAGGSDNSSLVVGINTNTAGAKSGTVALGLESDGEGINTLGQTALTGQTVNVSGDVYRLAEAGAHTPEPVVLADSHVGGTAQQTLSMTNTAANDGFSESLNAIIGGDTGDVSSSGSFDLLAAQATDNSSLVVGIDTGSAGAKSGTATISSESDGTGTSDIVPNEALADQTVNVSGNVYRLAEASAHTPEPVALGNVHVGDTAQQALTIGNTAAADGFSEALNAVLGATSGDAMGVGSISQLAAGGSDNSSLVVGINTDTAGAKSGTVALGLESDGDGINTLGQTALAGQTVNVSGGVFSLAEATIDNPLAFAFGNVHVGDAVSQALEISNTALDGLFSESLNASFGAASDALITNDGGSIALLAAGGTDTSSMSVGVDTTSAGVVIGTQTINFESDGTGTSGLGITGLDSQDLSVTASIDAGVYRLANPEINNTQPVAFGNVREGAFVAEQSVSITNDVPDDGFSEALNAQAAGNTGGVRNNGGSFDLLGPGATNDTAIAVSIDTSTAGDKSGNATIDFESDGTGSSGLGITGLPSQNVAVTGAVYRLARGSVSPDPIDLYARVGDVVGQNMTIDNTAAADGFSENLDTSASSSGNASVTGGPVLALAAGSSDSSAFNVSANTDTAGVFSGRVDVAFESNGQEWGLGSNVDMGEQQIDVNTSVYAEAFARVTPAVDFGTVRVGTSTASSIDVGNTGSGALVDVLQETSRSVDVPFSVDALTGDIAAGDSRTLGVGMDTSVAGVFTGEASLGFASHNDNLSDVDLGTETIAFTGTVNNLAEAAFVDDPGGDGVLSGSGAAFLLDFGTIFSDDLGAMFDDVLGVKNIAAGPADLLAGTFSSLSNCDIFCFGGETSFDDFFDIAAEDVLGNLLVTLDTTDLTLGLYEDNIFLNPFSTLAGFNDIALDPITLSFRINVRQSGGDVPLPGTLALVLLGLLAMRQQLRHKLA